MCYSSKHEKMDIPFYVSPKKKTELPFNLDVKKKQDFYSPFYLGAKKLGRLYVIILGHFLPFSRGRNWPHSQSKIATFFPNTMLRKVKKIFFFF